VDSTVEALFSETKPAKIKKRSHETQKTRCQLHDRGLSQSPKSTLLLAKGADGLCWDKTITFGAAVCTMMRYLLLSEVNYIRVLFWSAVLFPCHQMAVAAQSSGSGTGGKGLALVASSPFRMILRPTPSSLDSVAMQVLESAIASTIVSNAEQEEEDSTGRQRYIDADVVIQEVDFIELRSSDSNNATSELVAASNVRFFALATCERDDGDATASGGQAQRELNAVIETIFQEKGVQEAFFAFCSIPIRCSGTPTKSLLRPSSRRRMTAPTGPVRRPTSRWGGGRNFRRSTSS